MEGLRAYRTFFSVMPTLVNVCFSKVHLYQFIPQTRHPKP